MIDNLTNNPRRREPLRNQWWVPDSKEMLEKMDWEFLAPVRKLNAPQKTMFKKIVKENYGLLLEQPTSCRETLLGVPLLCKDHLLSCEPSIALITEPIFTGSCGQCYSVPFVRWLDGPATPVLLKKFLSTLEKNVAYENPFYQETKE
nr:MAG TPA: hypothetical protein [Caudoviricetes sp.]